MNRILLLIFMVSVFLSGCSSYQSKSITLPRADDDITWSRAHNYIIKYSSYHFGRLSPYVISSDPQSMNQITVSREYNPDNTVTFTVTAPAYVEEIQGNSVSFMDKYNQSITDKMVKGTALEKKADEPRISTLDQVIKYLKTGK